MPSFSIVFGPSPFIFSTFEKCSNFLELCASHNEFLQNNWSFTSSKLLPQEGHEVGGLIGLHLIVILSFYNSNYTLNSAECQELNFVR
jgi:hypothetical protein